ncbi:MAG: hypothetical protein D6719_09155 [Candidatus Dadabacteria bacterium]|nr:MAG: hypothetical protein D6719_09155 [Candidatus Dadabacteria bacterium]
MRISAIFILPFLLAGQLYAQKATFVVEGTAKEELGKGVECIGDFNGDGKPEIAIGVPRTNIAGGEVRIYSSSGKKIFTLPKTATTTADGLGASVSPAGDLNQDGFDDIIAGAPLGGTAGQGQVQLIYGPDASTVTSIEGFTAQLGANFGESIDSLFDDINGNGTHEIIVAAPDADVSVTPGAGEVYIIDPDTTFTNPVLTFSGDSSNQELGRAVASIGDQDGNNKRDVLAGAPGAASGSMPSNSGIVRLFSSDTSLNSPMLLEIGARIPLSRFGSALAAVGDQDGDGVEDFIVGAPDARINNQDNRGQVILFSVSKQGSVFTERELCKLDGENTGDNFGASVIGLGDINGDGRRDFAVGAPKAAGGRGRVYLYSYTPIAIKTADRIDGFEPCLKIGVIEGASASENFGTTLAGRAKTLSGCDLNGDGLSDVGAASLLNSTGDSLSGRVVFFNSKKVPTSAEFTFIVEKGSAKFKAKNTLNSVPDPDCYSIILARWSDTDLNNMSPVRVLYQNPSVTTDILSLGAIVPRVKRAANGEHWVLHMVSVNICSGNVIVSNVHSKLLNCGLLTQEPVSPERFFNFLKNKIATVAQIKLKRKLKRKKKRCRKLLSARSRKRCLRRIRLRLKNA